jgi:heme exporter protein D
MSWADRVAVFLSVVAIGISLISLVLGRHAALIARDRARRQAKLARTEETDEEAW